MALLLLFVGPACGGDSESSPPSTTTAPASSPPAAASATPNPSSCPIDAAVCDFALELLPLLRAGDVEGFVDRLEPVEATCRQGVAGFGGPSPALCAGAADGEVRRGYWNVQAGEGLIVTEGELKASLERWFPAIEAASGNDAYGAGELQIGAVACARARGTASGECSGDFVRAFYTFINPPNADVSQGTGIPGQRTTFHVSMHFDQDGRLRADGFGTTVPPNAPLDGGTFNAIGDDGSPLVLEFYPWRP